MKCRLYPNKTQAKAIDDAIHAVHVFHNCVIWDMFTNKINVVEKPSRDKEGEVVHFPKISAALTAAYKNHLMEEHPIISACPANALLTKIGVWADLERELGKKPIEFFKKPPFYSKLRPRKSFTYQETFGKIQLSENRNVLYIKLHNKIGTVKIRGWNQRIRFDADGTLDFAAYAGNNKRKKVTITVSRDNCGDYFISFKLTDVYRPMAVVKEDAVGIDVGIKNIAILSDGTTHENKQYKKEAKPLHKKLNRQMSRRQGWANEVFRAEHKKNTELQPSGRYLRTKQKMALLDRKIARKRELWNHEITKSIIARYGFIGVESLNITGMFRNKHLSNALSDAGMGQVLAMLNYKAQWYGRTLQAIGQWTPSSKRCSHCKHYIKTNLTLSVRQWTCPECGTHHDRDINAAKNILDYAINLHTQVSA